MVDMTGLEAKFVPFRPLVAGIRRDLAQAEMPVGSFMDIKNFDVTPNGLERRHIFRQSLGGNVIADADRPVRDVVAFWKTDGNHLGVLLTSRYLYTVNKYSAPTPIYSVYDTGTLSVSGTTVTGVGTAWETSVSFLKAGDIIILDPSGTAYERTISSISSDTSLVIDAVIANEYLGTEYIENGDVGAATVPTLDGGTSGLTNGVSSNVEPGYTGAYAWALSKSTTPGGGDTSISLTDNGASGTTDLHGLTAGNSYRIRFGVKAPLITASINNFQVRFREYYSGSWNTTHTWSPTVLDTWRYVSEEITLNASTTGVDIVVFVASAEGQYYSIFLDDVSLRDKNFAYEIRRTFNTSSKHNIDSTIIPVDGVQQLVITDGYRQPYGFDGSSLGRLDADLDYYCQCVCYFANRLWMGNIKEAGSYYKQRLRWSAALDPTSFDSISYQDFPFQKGELLRIAILDRYLVLYFEDAIHIGRLTNMPLLPVMFTKLDTGGIGLIGPKAVAAYAGGHFFVGQNDIYFLDAANLNLTPLGAPVKELGLDACTNTDGIYVTVDIATNQIIFGFPVSGSDIGRELKYSTLTKSWSSDDYTTEFLGNPFISIGITWDGLSGYINPNTWDGGMAAFASWDDIGNVASDNGIYISRGGYLLVSTSSGTEDDWDGGNVQGYLESGEIDFGSPDIDKTVQRLSLKLKERPTANVNAAVYGSVDGGETYRQLGNILFTNALREGKVDFRMTGSTFKFKIFFSGIADTYKVTEIVLKLVERDEEVRFE